jgi:hypothetical protein
LYGRRTVDSHETERVTRRAFSDAGGLATEVCSVKFDRFIDVFTVDRNVLQSIAHKFSPSQIAENLLQTAQKKPEASYKDEGGKFNSAFITHLFKTIGVSSAAC